LIDKPDTNWFHDALSIAQKINACQ